MIDFKELSLKELSSIIKILNKPEYVAQNIYKWVYRKRIEDFSLMTDIAKQLRQHMQETMIIPKLELVQKEVSKDGTAKFLFRLSDGNTIEAVLIPYEGRVTLCVSSQVGCKMGCVFCFTAKQGFVRSLTASEIVNQVLMVNDIAVNELGYKIDENTGIRAITNIVFMGMGEPMDNLDNVIKSIDILTEEQGLAFGLRKITVSTCGIIPKMMEFKERSKVKLAVSLNASNEKKRNQLMPVNKSYPLKDLIRSIRELQLRNYEFVTFEYILFAGVNDTDEDALELVKLIKGLPAKVNLIYFNPHPGAPEFQPPGDKRMYDFAQLLLDRGIVCRSRESRGKDISAACGQLRSREK
jgi:23S rRNA (adenine2503-C2)-methyltransferase